MRTQDMQTQCRLVRGQANQVSWIPSEFAQQGRVIDLKDRRGVWTQGWRVERVYGPAQPAAVIAERERDHASHRRATDI